MALAIAHSRGLDGLQAPPVTVEALEGKASGESSAAVRERVGTALACQQERQRKPSSCLSPGKVETLCAPDEAGASMLKQASQRLDLSARAWHRILKVARTIADLGASKGIRAPQSAEAIQYRRLPGG